MKIINSLPIEENSRWAFVGSGGKTTTIFALARQYKKPILITTTTHLSLIQAQGGDQHWEVEDEFAFPNTLSEGITVVTHKGNYGEKVKGLSDEQVQALNKYATEQNVPMLIEADGSRLKPLKAPAIYEPVIPSFVNQVVVVAGMRGYNNPLNSKWVHRAEIYSDLSGDDLEDIISIDSISKVLSHKQGGLKNIPENIEATLVLTQIDDENKSIAASKIAKKVNQKYYKVILANLKNEVVASFQPIAGVILAAGESTRLGRPKQFLDWFGKPFVQVVVENAIEAGLSPVIVVTGEAHEIVIEILKNFPVKVVQNKDWKKGQGGSVAVAIKQVGREVGGAVFMLVDQPQIKAPLLESLIANHAASSENIVAPLIDGQRGNPVLFDKITFEELANLKGEKGGRQLFSKYHVQWVPWVDDGAMLDVDTEEDYQRLLERYSSHKP